jgi:hypothetical protein
MLLDENAHLSMCLFTFVYRLSLHRRALVATAAGQCGRQQHAYIYTHPSYMCNHTHTHLHTHTHTHIYYSYMYLPTHPYIRTYQYTHTFHIPGLLCWHHPWPALRQQGWKDCQEAEAPLWNLPRKPEQRPEGSPAQLRIWKPGMCCIHAPMFMCMYDASSYTRHGRFQGRVMPSSSTRSWY